MNHRRFQVFQILRFLLSIHFIQVFDLICYYCLTCCCCHRPLWMICVLRFHALWKSWLTGKSCDLFTLFLFWATFLVQGDFAWLDPVPVSEDLILPKHLRSRILGAGVKFHWEFFLFLNHKLATIKEIFLRRIIFVPISKL